MNFCGKIGWLLYFDKSQNYKRIITLTFFNFLFSWINGEIPQTKGFGYKFFIAELLLRLQISLSPRRILFKGENWRIVSILHSVFII